MGDLEQENQCSFFFQAEDGIRDYKVTGVQTCALPIWQLEGIRAGALDSGARLTVERCEAAGGEAANRWYTLGVQGASGKQVRQLFERQGEIGRASCRERV